MCNLPRFTRVMMVGILFASIGCGTKAAPLSQTATIPPELGARFDADACGVIRGRVIWSGPIPSESDECSEELRQGFWYAQFRGKNPAKPQINESSTGVVGAVLFLRKVDFERSKAWDVSPARIVMKDQNIRIEQDGAEHSIGVARISDNVEMVSRGPALEILRAREAAFFSLPFPEINKPVARLFSQTGIVELSSAALNFWARSWLFISDHPYIVRSDERGDFILSNVPEGEYEVVCWMPSWRVLRCERDPEVTSVARLYFGKPFERSVSAVVRRGETATVEFRVAMDDFPKK